MSEMTPVNGSFTVPPDQDFDTVTFQGSMQQVLQEKYLEKWGGLSPEMALSKMLWLHGELGEASDIMKKQGNGAIMTDEAVRRKFVEELCDALMYFNDVLLCYGITPEEFITLFRL